MYYVLWTTAELSFRRAWQTRERIGSRSLSLPKIRTEDIEYFKNVKTPARADSLSTDNKRVLEKDTTKMKTRTLFWGENVSGPRSKYCTPRQNPRCLSRWPLLEYQKRPEETSTSLHSSRMLSGTRRRRRDFSKRTVEARKNSASAKNFHFWFS